MSVQRVRDPLHNLITFDMGNELERTLWKVLCSRPFQRLRRVKQLGFSDIVYPGATHTRFAHSLGVFHTARDLMRIVREKAPQDQRQESRENIALAATLVHDVGHGPFSHAFETVGKVLGLKLADHEQMSDMLIRQGEVAETLSEISSGFANDVADMVKKEGRKTIHNAVVSSQFDADRLDYMRRDRLMTGSHHAAIDFTWLLANLDVAEVPVGVDDTKAAMAPTFVIGPKAVQAAEAYVLGLFQLYPTVYFHKTTRGAEKVFAELLVRLVTLIKNDSAQAVGLPQNHPLVKFAKAPEDVETALNLDDTVVWGSLSQLREADDPLIRAFAARLQDRKLFKCIDVRAKVQHRIDPKNEKSPQHIEQIDKCCESVYANLQDMRKDKVDEHDVPIILLDKGERTPYKPMDESRGPLEQIYVRTEGGALIDLKQRSDVVAALRDFKLMRAYYDRDQPKLEQDICSIIEEEVKGCQ